MNKETIETLLKKRLITMKESPRYPGLFVIKYTRKVFYDNLWTPELLECRGLVIDKDYNIVALPFRKIFNYMENGTTLDRDTIVYCTRKINGFMAALTNYDGQFIVSTTGSLDSDFVKLAEKYLLKDTFTKQVGFRNGLTFLFEICDPEDPHIIPEDKGAYLIGSRITFSQASTNWHTPSELDDWANRFNCYRPIWTYERFSDVVTNTKTVTHEGFVVQPIHGYHTHPGIKLKSPYYKTTKFLARMKEEKLDTLLNNPQTIKQRIDEEFYSLIDYLHSIKDDFVNFDEQRRIQVIREYILESEF